MKKYIYTAVLLASALSKGYSMDTSSYGNQSYGKETVNSIQANGSVLLEGTKVLGTVNVNGNLDADEAAIGNLHVNGQVGLTNCLVSNQSVINGSLSAENSKFQGEISISSQKVLLRTCSIDSLKVREVVGYKGVQVVDLRSGTKVAGPLVVDSGNGEVWLSSSSEVNGPVDPCPDSYLIHILVRGESI
jgi:hypothetical protein